MTHPGLTNTFFRVLCRVLARLLLRLQVRGVENIPRAGPVLFTMNHLGGGDPVLVIGWTPRTVSVTGKSEIMTWRGMGAIARAYGMIPIRRGEVDRVALRQLIGVLRAGGVLLIAPEGRESLSGALEPGKTGAVFLAQNAGQHADVPILPIAITGTAWRDVLPTWRRLRRPCVTLTFGLPYRLPEGLERRAAADLIMRQIAALLPPEYQGVYRVAVASPEPDAAPARPPDGAASTGSTPDRDV